MARPVLLFRARPKAAVRERFEPWFLNVHIREAARIPGVSSIAHGRTSGGAWLGVLSFATAADVQTALASPEAAYARGTWEQWAGDLEELQVELWAPLGPLRIYESPN